MHPDIEALRARVARQRFRPRALVTFLMASVAVARRTATGHPDLVRSWRRGVLCHALLLPLVALSWPNSTSVHVKLAAPSRQGQSPRCRAHTLTVAHSARLGGERALFWSPLTAVIPSKE